MMTTQKKYLFIAFCFGLILLFTVWFLLKPNAVQDQNEAPVYVPNPQTSTTTEITATEPKVIGKSVAGRVIESYTYGTGSTSLLFVGGIHGGYEWNSVLLAYEFIDALASGTISIPENISITVIPVLNPDGLFEVIKREGRFLITDIPQNNSAETGAGRFNQNGVDLNRNFACAWQPKSTWRGKTVEAGSEAFSEPEAKTLRDFVITKKPHAVIFWHSKANAVYASECEEGILSDTLLLMKTYAQAASYQAIDSFDAYPVSGDAEGWLASLKIPAITVELETRADPEWDRNKLGIESVLSLYSK